MKEFLKRNRKMIDIVICCIGVNILLGIFNYIVNIYNMNTLHRCLCVIIINFTNVFFIPLFNLLFNKS